MPHPSERGIRIGNVVDIKAPGAPRAPVVEEIARLGGPIRSPSTVPRWRDGTLGGGLTAERIVDAEAIGLFGKAAAKNRQFLTVVQTGLSVLTEKEQQQRGKHVGFTQDLVNRLEITPESLRSAFRLMRADMVFTSLFTPLPDEVAILFGQAVQNYLTDHPKRGTRTIPLGQRLTKGSWDGSLEGFYKILSEMGNQTMSLWTTYELPVLERWYQKQSERNYPTGFDATVIQAWDNYQLKQTAALLQEKTGIHLDEQALTTHIHVLSGELIAGKETPSEETTS